MNSLYHMTNDGAVQVLSGQIAILTGVFAFGPFETGILGGTSLLVNAVVQMLTGVMSDRRDPSRFLPIGILIVGVSCFLVAAATSFWALLLFVSLLRVGASFYHPVGMSWIGRSFPPRERGRSLGFRSALGYLGEDRGQPTGAGAALACRGAVTVNTRLAPAEASLLLSDLARCRDPWTCPHGRPILLTFDHRDLEKRFGRRT